MEKKKSKFAQLSEETIRIILIILGSALSTTVLSLSVLAMLAISDRNYNQCSIYLLVVFIVLGLARLITYIRERTVVSLVRFISLFVLDVSLGILIYFAKDNPYFFSLCGGLYCVTIIASRILKIISKPKTRVIVFNMLIIVLFVFLAIALFIPYPSEEQFAPMVVLCLIIAMSALAEVLSNAFAQLKLKTLFKIIIRTYALEVILGLFTIAVASSLVFVYFEPDINDFWTGLWYAFAVVTTIGFGDFAAVTPIGRAVTVILGLYGLIVVAVITSIIVNFYNETAGKRDSKELKDIKDEAEQEKNNKK